MTLSLRKVNFLALAAPLLLSSGALAAPVLPRSGAFGLTWTSCGTSLECATLEVPLEWADGSTNPDALAHIALVKYPATVPEAQRLGSLLTNPGGPGAPGVAFVKAGAGAAISALTGGLYDIIGFDPRGVGATTPKLQCFANAGEEYDFASAFPSAPNLWAGQYSNATYDASVADAITAYDLEVKKLSDACVSQNSPALATSSAIYVAYDMAAIIDALDGPSSNLNYWGFSYGTIYLAEFIQAFPHRVGRILADGVVDPLNEAAALIPTDQISVPDAIADFVAQCESAGSSDCPLSVSPTSGKSLTDRLYSLFETLFKTPVNAGGLSIGMDVFAPFLWSFLQVPTTWQSIASAIQELENGNGTSIASILTAGSAPTDRNAPGRGILSTYPLQCLDNAPSSTVTIDEVISLIKNVSIDTKTPLLNADITYISFCRNYPDTRPALRKSGISFLLQTNEILTAANKSVLIINPIHDPVTPFVSAQKLRSSLPTSSVLAIRGGSGHTSVSWASLGIANVVANFFVNGTLPEDQSFYAVDQEPFPSGVTATDLVTPPVFNGTYTEQETAFLEAVYGIGAAFLALR